MPTSSSIVNIRFEIVGNEKAEFPIITIPYRLSVGEIINLKSYNFEKLDYEDAGNFKIVDIKHEIFSIGDMGDISTTVYVEKVKN